MHDLSITKTNSRHLIPTCSCGWIGSVHMSWERQTPNGYRVRVYEQAQADAIAEHADHVKRDGPLTATRVLDPAEFAHLLIPKR